MRDRSSYRLHATKWQCSFIIMATLVLSSAVCLLLFVVVSFHECWAFRLAIQQQCRHHQKGHRYGASSTVRCATTLQQENESAAAPDALPRVLCIGEALFDCIADWSARGLNVQELVASQKWKAFPGGATANVAAACSKLGTRSAFAGCVGDDDMGQELIEILGETYSVDVSLVQKLSKYPTRSVMVTRDMSGDRAFGAFYPDIAADDFADAHLDADVLLKKAEPIFQQLEEHDNGDDSSHSNTLWMVCGTLSLAYPESAKAIRGIVHRGKKAAAGTCRLLVDVNWRPVFWKCDNNTKTDTNARLARENDARCQILDFLQQHADVIKLTNEEAEWLLGVPAATSLENATLVAKAFPKALAVLVTAGEQGASYNMWGISGQVAALDNINIVETTGAGDAFTAGFLHQLLQLDLDKASKIMPLDQRAVVVEDLIRFASITGGLTCTAEGAIAAQPTLAEVESYMATTYGIKQS